MAERVTVTLPAYRWEAILRCLASSGWDSMHAILTAELVKPQPADPVRCPKCGGPHPFHDPACVVHPDLIQDHENRSE
jgi:hypothetical protein